MKLLALSLLCPHCAVYRTLVQTHCTGCVPPLHCSCCAVHCTARVVARMHSADKNPVTSPIAIWRRIGSASAQCTGRENRDPYDIKCCKFHWCIQPWAQICSSMLLLWCGRMQFVLTSVLVNCNNCGHNHTCSCALMGKKWTVTRVCLRSVAGEYTALARARLCRAVYSPLHWYTGTHSSLCTFFPFVHRAWFIVSLW